MTISERFQQKSKLQPHRQAFGFTLIELLVVVAIIGVLAALLIVNLVSARERGGDARAKSELNSIKTALRLYYNDFQMYPEDNVSGQILGCGDGTAACAWDGPFATTTTTYMQKLPSTSPLVVYKSDGNDQFVLTVAIKNTSDPALAESVARCSDIYFDITGNTLASTKFAVCSD